MRRVTSPSEFPRLAHHPRLNTVKYLHLLMHFTHIFFNFNVRSATSTPRARAERRAGLPMVHTIDQARTRVLLLALRRRIGVIGSCSCVLALAMVS